MLTIEKIVQDYGVSEEEVQAKVAKESKEHPEFSELQVLEIVRDHYNSGADESVNEAGESPTFDGERVWDRVVNEIGEKYGIPPTLRDGWLKVRLMVSGPVGDQAIALFNKYVPADAIPEDKPLTEAVSDDVWFGKFEEKYGKEEADALKQWMKGKDLTEATNEASSDFEEYQDGGKKEYVELPLGEIVVVKEALESGDTLYKVSGSAGDIVLDLGNNFNEDHFYDALTTARPDVFEYIARQVSTGDDVRLQAQGNAGKIVENVPASDFISFYKRFKNQINDMLYGEGEINESKKSLKKKRKSLKEEDLSEPSLFMAKVKKLSESGRLQYNKIANAQALLEAVKVAKDEDEVEGLGAEWEQKPETGKLKEIWEKVKVNPETGVKLSDKCQEAVKDMILDDSDAGIKDLSGEDAGEEMNESKKKEEEVSKGTFNKQPIEEDQGKKIKGQEGKQYYKITKDGEKKAEATSEAGAWKKLQELQPKSVHYATTYDGWKIEAENNQG